MTLEVQEALNQARGDVAAAVQEAAEIISTAEEDAGSLAISFVLGLPSSWRRSASKTVFGLTEQPRRPQLARVRFEIGQQRASFFEPRPQPLNPVQLRRDRGERAVRIVRELGEPALAADDVRAQRPHESVRLLDQPTQLGFGHPLVADDVPQLFEKCQIRCLSQRAGA
jgi:hypothetical protein